LKSKVLKLEKGKKKTKVALTFDVFAGKSSSFPLSEANDRCFDSFVHPLHLEIS
jgi:hypothetical protein